MYGKKETDVLRQLLISICYFKPEKHIWRQDIMAMKHKPRDIKRDECGVVDCKLEGHKSLSPKKVRSAVPNLKLRPGIGKRVHLCKDHYKEFKKKTKKERELDRLAWE